MLRLWRVATHKEVARFVSDEARVWSISFSPDGKSLYYGGLRPHRLDFPPLESPDVALEQALMAGGFLLVGANLVR